MSCCYPPSEPPHYICVRPYNNNKRQTTVTVVVQPHSFLVSLSLVINNIMFTTASTGMRLAYALGFMYMDLITPLPAPTNSPIGPCKLFTHPLSGESKIGTTNEGRSINTGNLPTCSLTSSSAKAFEKVYVLGVF